MSDDWRPERIYVGAPFSEWPLVLEIQTELRRRGAAITYDWAEGASLLPPGTTDADVSEERALEIAIAEIEGVLKADACLFLTVADKSKGAGMWTELGAAIVARRVHDLYENYGYRTTEDSADLRSSNWPVIAVCGPMRDRSIFSRFAKRFADWQGALPFILRETS